MRIPRPDIDWFNGTVSGKYKQMIEDCKASPIKTTWVMLDLEDILTNLVTRQTKTIEADLAKCREERDALKNPHFDVLGMAKRITALEVGLRKHGRHTQECLDQWGLWSPAASKTPDCICDLTNLIGGKNG